MVCYQSVNYIPVSTYIKLVSFANYIIFYQSCIYFVSQIMKFRKIEHTKFCNCRTICLIILDSKHDTIDALKYSVIIYRSG